MKRPVTKAVIATAGYGTRKGKWMTTGDPLRFLKTTIEFALEREDLGPAFKKHLKSLDLK